MPGYLDDAGRYIASLLRRNPMPTPAFRGRKAPISVETLRQAYGPVHNSPFTPPWTTQYDRVSPEGGYDSASIRMMGEDAYDAAFPNGMGVESAPDIQRPLRAIPGRGLSVPLRYSSPYDDIANELSQAQPLDPNFLGGGELLQHVRDNHRWRAAALRSGMDDAGEYSSRLANGNMIPDAQQFRTLDARSLTDGGVRRAMQIASDEAIRRKLTALGVGGGLTGALAGGIALDSMDAQPADEMYSGQEDLSGMAPEAGMLPDMEMPDLGMPDINGSRPGATISARALAEMADSLDAPPDEGPSIEDLMTDYSTEEDNPLDTALMAAESSPLPSASPRTVISPVSQQQYSQPAANNYRQLGPIRQILSNMRDRREYRQARRRSR